MNIVFDMSDIRKQAAQYANADRVVREEVTRGMTRTVIQIEADAKKRVPTDTHNLQRSLTHEVSDQGTSVIGRAGTNQPYGKIVEEGRTPGKMPPAGVLLGWMRRHGIAAEYEYVIRRAVNRRKRPQPYLKPAYDVNRQKITKEFGQVVPRNIINRLAGGK